MAIFDLKQVKKISGMNSALKPHISFYSDGLAIQDGLPNIGHMKVNNGRQNCHLEFDELDLFYSA